MEPAMAFRVGWGTVLAVAPDWVLRATGRQSTWPARGVLRVLGARHLVQVVACSRARDPRTALAVGAVVDAAHAASCLAITCVSPTWRRAAAIDFVIAAALAVDTLVVLRR
jgi:hypothetical protein